MPTTSLNSFNAKSTFKTAHGEFTYFRLAALEEAGVGTLDKLPFSIRVLLEATLRTENGKEVTKEDIARIATYDAAKPSPQEIPFMPARVILQDFTGVPCVVDLAAMRNAVIALGGDPQKVNPIIPVDLVIDHSVQVDYYGTAAALQQNSELEFSRNRERYAFLRWGQRAFKNFRVVPPASGIVHQVNLEYLAPVAQIQDAGGEKVVFPDSLVGTDSHTTMINGAGVLGWGVGGIEAEATMLGQPYYMMLPEVIGVKVKGQLNPGVTATDLVLVVTQLLRKRGVVNKFVEFFGPGLSAMSLADRATIANMAPEYGATCGFFPVDDETLKFLRETGRPDDLVATVEAYAKANGFFRTDATPDPVFTDVLELDLATVKPSLAGPKRPQDRIDLTEVGRAFAKALTAPRGNAGFGLEADKLTSSAPVAGLDASLHHGSVVIAAITSCTNTSNPSVMVAAGLVAKKAVEKGLKTKPYVKTSLAPGSRVVTDYLNRAGLTPYLDQLGFQTVGYGCTTCIGNSGPLPENIGNAITQGDLVVASVLSGNRNFEGRVHALVKANYLASPPLVVAFALAGNVNLDLSSEPIGVGKDGHPVYLKDIWPTADEINAALRISTGPQYFRAEYDGIENKNADWNAVPVPEGALYAWDDDSTYIQNPPYFDGLKKDPSPIQPITGAKVLAKLGDSITTDHISPAGDIALKTPAGAFLLEKGVAKADFNSYGSRRGNDRIMTRGTFANVRLRNELAKGQEGGLTSYPAGGDVLPIFDAAQKYKATGTPTIIIAGVDYGMGSSRDWAAKGTMLLGAKAVLAQSFERIHRSNLVGMGVLPLVFKEGEAATTYNLDGTETYDIHITDDVKPAQLILIDVTRANGEKFSFQAKSRLDTAVDIGYYRHGGILQKVLRQMAA
jgi:aconitate hydratase